MSSIMLFLTVVQGIVAALLVAVILMQKSEGGGLGTGGSPAGIMSARGAADFLTRTTAILAMAFVALSIALAALATKSAAGSGIDTSLANSAPVSAPAVPAAATPPAAALSPAASPAASNSPATPDPLAGAVKK